MRRNLKLLTVTCLIVLGLAACNLPSDNSSPNTFATMKAITTSQAATLQANQTPGISDGTANPTLSFPTLPALNTPVNTSVAPVPTVKGANTPVPVSYCDWAAYVKDVTIPDGSIFAPGAEFTKTWRLQNIGTCAWTPSYDLVFSSGDKMGSNVAVGIPTTVYPNQVVDVSVTLRAPSSEGSHRGYWGLRNAAGVIFGIGYTAKDAFYVDIKVVGGMTTVLDFAADYCTADWRSEAGDLGCPGNVDGKKGYAIHVNDPKLEDGNTFHGLGILTVPQKTFNGYLKGFYPAYTVHAGDRFRGIVNCQYASDGCDVLFRIEYKTEGGDLQTLWQFLEEYDKQYYTFDVDLSFLAGKKVKFVLSVFADGSADADKPVWVAPRIDRPDNLITPEATSTKVPKNTRTPTPTALPTDTPAPTLTITPTP